MADERTQITIAQDTVCAGKRVYQGDVLIVDARDANLLINLKKAVKGKDPALKRSRRARKTAPVSDPGGNNGGEDGAGDSGEGAGNE